MKALLEALKDAKNVVILPHKSADGDALASSAALGKLLETYAIPYTIYTEEPPREDLLFLGDGFTVYEGEESAFDTAVAIDCGDIFRLGNRAPLFENARVKLVIDHHATNDGFGDIAVIDPASAATAELVAALFEEAGISYEKAATILYTGLVTDTGGFRYSNTTAKTHRLAANLLEAGAESAKVCHAVFEQNSIEKIRLEAAVMGAVTITHDGKTALAAVSEDLIRSFGASDEDTSNLSGLLRSVRGVETGILLREKAGEIKISMRTNEYIDAAAFCKTLGGGGHARAAGATVSGTLSEWQEKIIEKLGETYGRHS